MRLLGIDYGLKKIGISIGDDETKIASPVEVVDSIEEVGTLIESEGIDELVVGVPLAAGTFHSEEQLNLVQKFIDELAKFGKPIHQVDERYTSTESRRLQEEFGAEAPEDALAAMIILQSYFDERKT